MKSEFVTASYETKVLTFIFLFLQASFLLLLFFLPNPLWPLLALISLLIVPFVLTSPSNILFLVILYIVVFPNENWGTRYDDFFITYVNWKLVVMMLIGTAFVLSIRSLFEKRWKFQWSFLDKMMLIFLAYTFVNMFWGIYQNGQVKGAMLEFYHIALYGVYFLARFMMNKDEKWIAKFFIIYILATTIAAIQYVFLAFSYLDISSIFINRVTTQQPHLAQIAIPFLAGTIFFIKEKTYKILSFFLLIPIFLMVIFSQQRALYVAIFLTLLILLFFIYTRNGFKPSKLINFSLGVFVLLLLLIVFFILAQKYFDLQFILTVAKRVETLQDVGSDESWRIRFGEVSIALTKWKEHIFFGSGLGSTYPNTFLGRNNTGVDNSYAFVLWKLGIWGFSFFLIIYIVFLIQGIKTFWAATRGFEKLVISSIVAGMSGLMLIAVTNMSIIQYRFNMIWAISIAIIQHYYIRKVRLKDV